MSLYAQAVAAERAAKIARDNADHAAGVESLRQQLLEVTNQRDALHRLCKFNEKTMADLICQRDDLLAELTTARNALIREGMQRDELLAALERADDILTTEYDHVSPWVKATIARVKESK